MKTLGLITVFDSPFKNVGTLVLIMVFEAVGPMKINSFHKNLSNIIFVLCEAETEHSLRIRIHGDRAVKLNKGVPAPERKWSETGRFGRLFGNRVPSKPEFRNSTRSESKTSGRSFQRV